MDFLSKLWTYNYCNKNTRKSTDVEQTQMGLFVLNFRFIPRQNRYRPVLRVKNHKKKTALIKSSMS